MAEQRRCLSPALGAKEAPAAYTVSVAERGRVVLPVDLRRRLKIRQGDHLALLVEEDGTVTLQTRAVAVRMMRGMYKHLVPVGRLASDELIAERRREARNEQGEGRESVAHAGRKGAR